MQCLACLSPSMTPHLQDLKRCPQCGFVTADLDLEKLDLQQVYSDAYFQGEEYVDYLQEKSALQRNFRDRLNRLKKHCTNQHESLVEIGSAYGYFLDLARSEFQSSLGFEINATGAKHARENLSLNVLNEDFLESSHVPAQIDVLTLWDCVEHLKYPDQLLSRASRQMRPGSLIALTTGDIESWTAKIRGRNWRLIHPPTHLHYFSRRSLHALFDRLGFDLVDEEHCGFHRSFDNVAYGILALRAGHKNWYEAFRRMPLARKTFYLNLFDILFVIARKR